MKNISTLLLMGVTILVSACSTKPGPAIADLSGAMAGDLSEMLPCKFTPEGDNVEVDALCGTLTVPENWKDENSPLISLPVVKIPSTTANPVEPIFYLKGGPGFSNLAWNPPAWILENHDVIMVGYRGVDGSVALDCPEVDAVARRTFGNDLFSEDAKKQFAKAVQQCITHLTDSGIDLSGYTVSGVIEDIEAARIALGYEKINLYSRSYGTRIAQLYAHRHPNTLHRIVMIGLNTPGRFIYNRDDFDLMLRELSELCAADLDCSQRTDDLAQTIYDVNRSAPKHWLFMPIDLASVRVGTHSMLYSTSSMSLPIDMYLSASEGDYSGMAFLSLFMRFQAPNFVWGDVIYKGASLDLEYYKGEDSVNLGDTVMGAPMAEYLWPAVSNLTIVLDDPDMRVLHESNVDMLIVNGSLDFSTPPTAIEEAKPYWHSAKFVLLKNFGHVSDVENLQPEAFRRLIKTYYETGDVDASMYENNNIPFTPGLTLSILGKLLVGALMLLLIASVGLIKKLYFFIMNSPQ